MAYTHLPRGEFTSYLLGVLSDTLLVGDGEAPGAGGWDDDPNDPNSSYVPYVVLNPMATSEGSGSLGDSQSDYQVPYSITAYGVTRDQVEYYADTARKKLASLVRATVTLDGSDWKIQQYRANSVGGVSRRDNTEPSEFIQSDVVVIYLSKELS